MKLFHSGNSPYARRARIVARECGVGNIEEVDLAPMPPGDHPLLAYGPSAKVPALLADDGTFICETLLITRYLNDIGSGKLLSTEPKAYADAVALEGNASALMDSLFARSHENRRETGEKSPAVIEKEAARAARSYDALNTALASTEPVLNLATIAAVSALGYADWRHPDDDWRAGRPGLTAWFDGMMQFSSVADTKPIF